MPSPKSKRAAPTQDFNKYVFTRAVGPDVKIFPIASSQMKTFTGGASDGGADDSLTGTIPIGFDFYFNQKKYTRFVASTNGFLVLREESDVGAFNITDYVTTSNINSQIVSQFTTKGVLLCAWFDDIKNAYTDLSQLSISASDKLKIQKGIDLPPVSLNPSQSSLRYVNTVNKEGQKCLVVRWKSFSNYNTNANNIVTFEIIIYESGKIEFRYNSKVSLSSFGSDATNEGATIGIFINDTLNSDSTYWKFRDLSIGLGHPGDSIRKISKYGGAEYDPGYSDTDGTLVATPYNTTLFVSDVNNGTVSIFTPQLKNRKANWPGQDRSSCVMTFSPPVNRRKILPRKEIVIKDSKKTYPTIARTGDINRLGTKIKMYDDRRAISYGAGIVDYPTGLMRSYADTEAGVSDRINLFADFDVTGNTIKANVEQFIGNEQTTYIDPFTDHNRFEQFPNSIDKYYLTGSELEFVGEGFNSPLKSKTQIKIELPLHHSLQMFDVSSSIYYYNNKSKGFYIPQVSNAKSDLCNALNAVSLTEGGNFWPEDARGFGPIGNTLSSGSNTAAVTEYWSSDSAFGVASSTSWNKNLAQNLSKEYKKSIQNNSQYYSNEKDECFSIPINQPFLLEKAIFEIPMKMGSGWFNDRTTSCTPIGSSSNLSGDTLTANYGIQFRVFDFAGPAITVGLFNQINTGNRVHRDLILTGTIIPSGDNKSSVVIRQTTITPGSLYSYDPCPLWIFEPEGYLNFATPSSIVTPDGNNQFTGSVTVPTTAEVSNGIVICYETTATQFRDPISTTVAKQRSNLISTLLRQEKINLYEKSLSGDTQIQSINPIGRSSKGFEPSGRSYFGKEFNTFQNIKEGRVNNPLFVSSSYESFPTSFKTVLEDSEFQGYAKFAVPVNISNPSPYLILPGDKLTLSISKMRPAIHTNGVDAATGSPVDYWRNSLRHDVWVNTGSIKVTLYGSLVKNHKEFHDTLNQEIASEAIHETLCAEPVLDQFEVEYKDSYFGSYTDDYITGSLAKKLSIVPTDGVNSIISIGSRGKVFSKLQAREKSTPDTSTYELNQNPFKGFRDQPWHEKTGEQRFVSLTSESERFYDSMMPDFQRCLQKDSNPLAIAKNFDTIFPAGTIDSSKKYSILFFDFADNFLAASSSITNNTWSWSYPFEPRYSNIKRELQVRKKYFANLTCDANNNFEITGSNPQRIDELLFARWDNATVALDFMCDYNLNTNKYVGMNNDDISRVIYGFGDKNSVIQTAYGQWGNNQQSSYRSQTRYVPGIFPFSYSISPIIRGWKYGVYSGLPTYSKTIFRRGRYGQFRDMLEQRLDAKFFQTESTEESPNVGILESPVFVKFVDSTGNITQAEKTWSQNLSNEVTSSIPYIDGEFTNRSEIDLSYLNQGLFTLDL